MTKNKQTLIASIAETAEDAVLLARVWDRISAGEQRNIPTSTNFLSGREQLLVQRLLQQGGIAQPEFFGGYDGAERRVAVYVPDYYDPEEFLKGEDGPVSALHLEYSDYDKLSHRDFLGSLMGQGIKREILGDLLAGDGYCDVLVLREMAGYLQNQLTQVGRVRVHTKEIMLSELLVPEQKTKVIRDTVASLRLDSILASGFQHGRSKAASYISAGKTEVNHRTVLKPDAMVAEGDIISARGLGKLRVTRVGGETKKGRISVVLEKFL